MMVPVNARPISMLQECPPTRHDLALDTAPTFSIEKRFVLLLILYASYPSFPITFLNLSLLITYHSLSTYLLALSVILHAHPAAMMTLSDSYA